MYDPRNTTRHPLPLTSDVGRTSPADPPPACVARPTKLAVDQNRDSMERCLFFIRTATACPLRAASGSGSGRRFYLFFFCSFHPYRDRQGAAAVSTSSSSVPSIRTATVRERLCLGPRRACGKKPETIKHLRVTAPMTCIRRRTNENFQTNPLIPPLAGSKTRIDTEIAFRNWLRFHPVGFLRTSTARLLPRLTRFSGQMSGSQAL